MLDGAPIVVIATGFNKSANKKTGAMIQTWIMRADMDPQQALYAGADSSICGSCPHRGSVSTTPVTRAVYRAERAKQRHHRGTPYYDPATGAHALRKSEGRACYVVIAQAPLTVWRAWRQGVYPPFDYTSGLLENRILRMGSYGDPVAVPPEVWAAALVGAKGRTGYTHQWKLQQAQAYRDFLMASADSEDEARAAEALGWRAFRVRGADEPLIAGREVMCPASTEYRAKTGKKVTCAECLMCGGADSRSKKSVSIIAHGSGKRFATTRLPRAPHRANPRVPGGTWPPRPRSGYHPCACDCGCDNVEAGAHSVCGACTHGCHDHCDGCSWCGDFDPDETLRGNPGGDDELRRLKRAGMAGDAAAWWAYQRERRRHGLPIDVIRTPFQAGDVTVALVTPVRGVWAGTDRWWPARMHEGRWYTDGMGGEYSAFGTTETPLEHATRMGEFFVTQALLAQGLLVAPALPKIGNVNFWLVVSEAPHK